VIWGEPSQRWTVSQDRAWQTLGIGPRWVRTSKTPEARSDAAVLDSPVGGDPANDLVKEDQPVVFEQAVMLRAINDVLMPRVFLWSQRSDASPPDRKLGHRCWLLISQRPSETTATTALSEQLLDAMIGAVGAAWSKPESAGASDAVVATQALKSGQVAGVLVLGGEALAALGHDGRHLNDLRGRSHRLRVGDLQVPVIVSFEPQQLLREPLAKAAAWHDLQLARSLTTQGECLPIKETESNLA